MRPGLYTLDAPLHIIDWEVNLSLQTQARRLPELKLFLTQLMRSLKVLCDCSLWQTTRLGCIDEYLCREDGSVSVRASSFFGDPEALHVVVRA